MKNIIYATILCSFFISGLKAQDFLDSLMTASAPKYVSASFKGTRLIGLPTIETQGKGTVEFRVSHRFGDFNSGGYNFWGLDGGASIWLGLDYALTDRFTIGVGRNSIQKLYDSNFKYKLLQQRTDNQMPISLTLYLGVNYTGMRDPEKLATGRDMYAYAVNRFSYIHSVLIARKFNERFSLQVQPMHIHYNIVALNSDKNTIFAIGGLARYKVSKRAAITAEYTSTINDYKADLSPFADVLSLGFELETGGHVFQTYVSNASALNPAQFVPYTTTFWDNGGSRLGFSISRVF